MNARKIANVVALPVKADAIINPGEGVCLDATGDAVPAADGVATLISFGVCFDQAVDNTGGADGDVYVRAHGGQGYAYALRNSAAGADFLAKSDRGATVYWAGANIVAKTDDTGARSAAGTLFDVDENGVWVVFP